MINIITEQQTFLFHIAIFKKMVFVVHCSSLTVKCNEILWQLHIPFYMFEMIINFIEIFLKIYEITSCIECKDNFIFETY